MRTAITIAKPHNSDEWELVFAPQTVDLQTGKPIAGTPIHEQAKFVRELRQSPTHNIYEIVQHRADFEDAVTLRFKKPVGDKAAKRK